MSGTNPMPSSHRVLFWILGKLLMKDDIWAVFRDREKKWPENRRNSALNKTPKTQKFAHVVLTALARSSSLSDQLWGTSPVNRTENNLCDTFWCLMSPCVLPPVENTLGIASCFFWLQRCYWKEMWLKDCQESSKGGPAPRKMSLQEPGVGAVLVGMVSSPVPQPPQKASALAPVTFQWCRSQVGMVGQQRPCYPQSSCRKLQKSFKGNAFLTILVLSNG